MPSTERLHTLNRHGEIRLTDAGGDVVADAARDATEIALATVDAHTIPPTDTPESA